MLKANKKILFLITRTEMGGAQRFLYEFTTRLNPEKYEILVAAGPEGKWDLLNRLDKKGIKILKLKYACREVNPIYDFFGTIEIMRLIKKFKPDFLHLNSSKIGVIGSAASQILKIFKPKQFKKMSVIYRIGGWSFNDPWPWWKKKIWILAEKITARFKDVIVVNNKNDYEQAKKLKIKPKKETKLIHNGIDALNIGFMSKEVARLKLFKKLSMDHKIVQGKFVIGTIANFYPTKGLKYLIETAKILNPPLKSSALIREKNTLLNLPPTGRASGFSPYKGGGKEGVKFIIIGNGPERKLLEELIKKYGLENEIILTGQIPKTYKYLKAFDVFVLPSVKEGFPWVVLEAMAAKLPIIATRVGALEEIIENNKSGILVQPQNPVQLADAIKLTLENEHLRQEFGIQAHQTVLFKFTIEKMVKETEMLFN